MLSINTNVNALNAQLALQQHTQEINRLVKIRIDASGPSANLDNVSAAIVPTYLTTAIRGNSQAIANIEESAKLLNKEKDTLTSIADALTTMKDSPIDSPLEYSTSSIPIFIAANYYKNQSLADGETINFQIGYKANDKISFALPNLTDLTSVTARALKNATSADVDTIDAALEAINRDNGSVSVMIDRLAATQAWLQTDLNRSIDYRSTLLSNAVTSATQQQADQEILKNAAQAILAQANASYQGIIDLIASAKISA